MSVALREVRNNLHEALPVEETMKVQWCKEEGVGRR